MADLYTAVRGSTIRVIYGHANIDRGRKKWEKGTRVCFQSVTMNFGHGPPFTFWWVGGIISKNHEESSRKSQDESSRISKLDSKESFRKFPLNFLQYMSIDLSSMIRPELIYCISFGVTWFEKSVFYARFPTLIHIKLSPMDVPYCTVHQYNHLMNFNWSFFFRHHHCLSINLWKCVQFFNLVK